MTTKEKRLGAFLFLPLLANQIVTIHWKKSDSNESQTYIFQVKLGHNAPPV